jgi:ABC-type molybdate transport system ATPase subunit
VPEKTRLPMIYVSHSEPEENDLADRILRIAAGRIAS